MAKIDYKVKYKELRNQWVQSLDTVFRDGYAQGYQAAQMDAQAQQANQMAQMMGGGGQPPGQEDPNTQGAEQMSPMDQAGQASDDTQMDQGVSELDAGIQELEELLSKSEGTDKAESSLLLKSINSSLHKIVQAKESKELRKSLNEIKSFNKKAEKLSPSFIKNASIVQKEAVSQQKSIISSVMKKWEEEEKKATKDIVAAIKKDE